MENYFNITPDNIKPLLNPSNNDNAFLGSKSSIPSSDVEDIILMFTDRVVSALPPRYKKLISCIDGEWLCGRGKTNGGASGGETTFTTALKPISDLQLYKNFSGIWLERRPANRLVLNTDYTVNNTTGEITLTDALDEGDTLIAWYNHTGLSDCLLLKLLVVNLTASYLAGMVSLNPERMQFFARLEAQAYLDIARLKEDQATARINLKLLDDISLVSETINDDAGGVLHSYPKDVFL